MTMYKNIKQEQLLRREIVLHLTATEMFIHVLDLDAQQQLNQTKTTPTTNKYQKLLNIIKDCWKNTTKTKHQSNEFSETTPSTKNIFVKQKKKQRTITNRSTHTANR